MSKNVSSIISEAPVSLKKTLEYLNSVEELLVKFDGDEESGKVVLYYQMMQMAMESLLSTLPTDSAMSLIKDCVRTSIENSQSRD